MLKTTKLIVILFEMRLLMETFSELMWETLHN